MKRHCFVALLAVTAAVTNFAVPTRASSASHTLYPTEGLQPGHYLEDATGRYRMYFDVDGASYTWDTYTSSMLHDLSDGPTLEEPDEFVYSPYPGWNGKLVAYNMYDEIDYAIWQYADPVSGEHFVRMDTDGCLRFYDQGGSNVRFSYCPE